MRPAGAQSMIAKLKRICELISAALFAAMFAAFLVQIFTRYVLNDPLSWTLEVCSITYVWIVFFASATIVDQRQHITFDLLYKSVRSGRQRVLAIVSCALIAVMFGLGLPGTIDYVLFAGRQHTLMLHIRLDLLYSCFALFAIGAIVAAVVRLRRLLGRDWKSQL